MTTWRAAWRDTTSARAGEHHRDHDTEDAAEACAAEQLAAGARGAVVYRVGGRRVSEQEPTITVKKIGARVTMSTEQALMYELITEDQAREMGWTPPPPVPWLRRKRWALGYWWYEHKPHVHLGPCDHGDCG